MASNPLTRFTLLLIGFALCASPSVFAQRGKIIKTATITAFDPNGDGFVSKTNSGFSNDGYYVDEFEVNMFGIPKLTGDATGDNVGKNCGITDLIPDTKGYSVYAVRDNANNLFFRFRVGDDNPSVEAWTILLDTDGLFGAADPNATADNPGFEIDITLIKNPQSGVWVYNIDGKSNCPTPVVGYNLSSNFQISIADEVSCGDPDYFYDILVPFDDVANRLGINENTGLRFAAVTNVSATCAMSGKIADISGVDDADYRNCPECAFEALVNNQCATSIVDLCQTCSGFEKDKVNAPTIDLPVRAGQSVISGTADPDIYIKVEIYPRTGGTDASPTWSATPREVKGVYAVGTIWSVTLTTPLQSYDKIVAKAQKNENSVPCGVLGGNQASASVTVVQPNTPPVALSQTLAATEDTPRAVTLTATDPENDVLTYSIVTQPAHGTLTGTGANLTYLPAANYNGQDSFTFQVSDGIFNSSSAGVITINIAAANDAPVASNQSLTTLEDQAIPSLVLVASDVDGDALTYTITAGPTNGILTGTAPNLTYTPNANFNGADAFSFRVNDGALNSNTATVSITVTAVPDAPVANSLVVSTAEDVALPVNLSGTDADGDALAYSIVANPAHGTLSGSGQSITYSPAANYNGPDAFTYRVNDGTTNSNTATVSITVTPVQDAPTATSQSVTTNEDVAKAITLAGVDVDGDVLTFTIVSGPTRGAISGTLPNITYTPSSNYNGSDAFTFKVNDGTVDSPTATVSITVSPVADAPTAVDQTVSTNEDVSKSITLGGSDADGDAITFSIVGTPSHGTIIGTGQTITYAPASNYNGSDSFTFRVSDGGLISNTATVTINVAPVQDAPTASSQSVTTTEDVAKAITLVGSDVDGDLLTYVIVTPPTKGVLTGAGASKTYTPTANANGSDSFTFRVNDGTANSNLATVSITITPANDAPVATDQTLSTDEDVPLTITLSASDIDGNALTYSIVSGPSNGTVTGTGATVTYRPNLNYNGPDNFTFRANDGTINSNIATISINVISINDKPVAQSQILVYTYETPLSITLVATDGDPMDVLTYSIGTPSNGVLSGAAPNIIYTPNALFTGSDSFTFTVNDGTVNSDVATISLSMNMGGANVPPVAFDQSLSLLEDQTIDFQLSAFDPNGDAITYVVEGTGPAHGTLVGSGASRTYIPNPNFEGSDSFQFHVADALSSSSTKTVSITVTGVQDAPIAQDLAVITNEETAINVTLVGVDYDAADVLTYIKLSDPTHGSLSGTLPNLTYTPAADFFGTDNFTFKVNDNTVDSNVGTVTITVNPIDDPPVAVDQLNISVQEDQSENVSLVATDPDGDALTYEVTDPAHGTVVVNGSFVTYTPDPNYNGADSFTFIAKDGAGNNSNVATISFVIQGVPDAPIAGNRNLSTNEDTALAVNAMANDADGDPLTYTLVSGPTHGSLSGSFPNLTYTPNADYFGSDNFTFKVNDGGTDSNIGTIQITVVPVGDPPVATGLNDVTVEDVPKNITLIATDPDGDPITYDIVTQPQHGTLIQDGQNVIYVPDLNFNGTDQFTFKVFDGASFSNIATVNIDVTGSQDIPAAADQSIALQEDQAKPVTLGAFDPDGDVLTYTIVSAPINGTLSGTAPALVYTPNANFFGSDSFSFSVNDGTATSNTATVSILVSPLGDAPIAFDQTGIAVTEETPKDITLIGTDSDGDPITYRIQRQPGHGTVSLVGSVATYLPAVDYFGPDDFTFVVNDGSNDSNEGTISLTVGNINDEPTADDQSVSTPEDTALDITLIGNDSDGDLLTYELLSQPTHGTLVGSGNFYTYAPAENYFGPDSFTFSVSDGSTVSNEAKVNILVTSVNDVPVISALPLIFYTKEDSAYQVCISVVDIDGDPVTYLPPVNLSGGGTMTQDEPPFDFCYIFQPALNFNGESVWEMKVSDSFGSEGVLPITMVVLPVNDPHTIVQKTYETKTDSAIVICPEIIDVENDAKKLISALPVVGSVRIEDNTCFTYSPKPGVYGRDSVEVKVCDVADPAMCATQTLYVDVLPKYNLPPEFFEDGLPIDTIRLVTDEDVPLSFCFEVKDPNKDNVALGSVDRQAGEGTMVPEANTQFCFRYAPSLNFYGNAQWKITFCDDKVPSLCGSLTVIIDVTPVNDIPLAANDTLRVMRYEEGLVQLLSNDKDVDGDALYLSRLVENPKNGTFSVDASGVFVYRSDRYFRGQETVVYEVCDNEVPQLCSQAAALVLVDDLPLKPYEGFSPNGDGFNDYWRIDGIDYYRNNKVRIFDRYNNLVFVLDGYNNEDKIWRGEGNHGIIEGRLLEGTYFYSIELGDGSKPISGFMVLKRD